MRQITKRNINPAFALTGALLLTPTFAQAQTDQNTSRPNQGTGIPRSAGGVNQSTTSRSTNRNGSRPNQGTGVPRNTGRTNQSYYYSPLSVYSLFPGGYAISSGGYVLNGTFYNGTPNYGNFGSPVFSMGYPFQGVRQLNGGAVINGNGVFQYAPPSYNYFQQAPVVPAAPIDPNNPNNTGNQNQTGQTDPNNPNTPGQTDPNNPNPDNPSQNNTDPAVNGYYLNPGSRKGQPVQKPILRAMRDRLNMTSSNLSKVWATNKIAYVSRHIDSNAKIAVYLNGKYQYSIKGSEYVNLTKRALRKNSTTTFLLDAPQRLGANQYLLTGRHAFRDAQGVERAVRVSYVLEDKQGRLVITQTGAQTLATN